MRVCFLAEKPCALSLGGIYLGIIDGFERALELDPADEILCEISPLGGFLPLRFLLDERFFLSPPPEVRLYRAGELFAVYACGFVRADPSLRVISQERFGNALLTLCIQGRLTLELDCETGFHHIPLPDGLEGCAMLPHPEGFLLEAENCFALIGRDGKTLVSSEGKVLEKSPLKAEIPFHDSMGHTAVCEWRGGELVACSVRSASPPDERTYALALFESALIGADVVPFLSPALAEKAGSLKEFLGDYLSVVLTDEREKVGLVYRRKENVFDVRYFRVELEDGKISNIIPL